MATAARRWRCGTQSNPDDIAEFEKQMRRKVHYVIEPQYLWGSIAEMARTQDGELLHTLQKGFDYIENESFASTFQGLFSEINLNSEKLGKSLCRAQCQALHHHQRNCRGAGAVFHRQRHAGRCL